MRKVINIYLLIYFLGALVVFSCLFFTLQNAIKNHNPTDYYKKLDFYGEVKNRFIDSTQHDYKMVFLKNNFNVDTLYFDFDESGLFDYIKVGDSLIKASGSLDIRLKRGKLDTIFKLDIYEKWKNE